DDIKGLAAKRFAKLPDGLVGGRSLSNLRRTLVRHFHKMHVKRHRTPPYCFGPPSPNRRDLKTSAKCRNYKPYWHLMCGLSLCFFPLSRSAATALQQSSRSTERRLSVKTG